MIRLLRVLFVVVLLGPQLSGMIAPAELLGLERPGCCESEQGCDVDCNTCAACASRISVASATPVVVVPEAPPVEIAAPASAAPAQPFPKEILHVPLSV